MVRSLEAESSSTNLREEKRPVSQLTEESKQLINAHVHKLLQSEEIARRTFLLEEVREHKTWLHRFSVVVAGTFFALLIIAGSITAWMVRSSLDNEIINLSIDSSFRERIGALAEQQRHEFEDQVRRQAHNTLATIEEEVLENARARLNDEFQEALDAEVRIAVQRTIEESNLQDLEQTIARAVQSIPTPDEIRDSILASPQAVDLLRGEPGAPGPQGPPGESRVVVLEGSRGGTYFDFTASRTTVDYGDGSGVDPGDSGDRAPN